MVRRFLLILTLLVLVVAGLSSSVQADEGDGRLITLYDRGAKRVFLSHEKTIGEALKAQSIELDARDTVEPATDEELVAPDYHVNIYRARPVVVVDDDTRTKVMTPFQTAERIAQGAGIALYPEDDAKVSRSSDLVGDGAGLVLTIDRAITFTFDLYGKRSEVRTLGDTVAEMLDEKGVVLGSDDRVSIALNTAMTSGLMVRVWREGKQTYTDEQAVAFGAEIVYDADRPVGYRTIQTPGEPGVQAITYEIEVKDGIETSRKEIARLITQQPTKQSLVIGIKGLSDGLTRSRGALFHTDSNGVNHRETYYDLEMGRVMQSCGQGGRYSVRFDGMKIDSDGYILVAANYARYPKCSVVETSAGPGKVYDTGGFVSHHPDGFDLATDWSNNNGR
jgi:uncharacterized protein YabE (DUF348 family)